MKVTKGTFNLISKNKNWQNHGKTKRPKDSQQFTNHNKEKLKTDQHEPFQKPGVVSYALEGYADPAPRMTLVELIMKVQVS